MCMHRQPLGSLPSLRQLSLSGPMIQVGFLLGYATFHLLVQGYSIEHGLVTRMIGCYSLRLY